MGVRAAGGLHHGLHPFDAVGQRLLNQNVLPACESRDEGLHVVGVARVDAHGLDVGLSAKRIRIATGSAYPEALGSRTQAVRVDVAERYDLGLAHAAMGFEVCDAVVTQADDAHADHDGAIPMFMPPCPSDGQITDLPFQTARGDARRTMVC